MRVLKPLTSSNPVGKALLCFSVHKWGTEAKNGQATWLRSRSWEAPAADPSTGSHYSGQRSSVGGRIDLPPKNSCPLYPWGLITGRTGAEAEALIPWPLDAKSWLFGKDPDAQKDWRQREKSVTGWDGWHHHLNEHESEETRGNSEGQGSLVCCIPWSCKELDTTWLLNNNTIVKAG